MWSISRHRSILFFTNVIHQTSRIPHSSSSFCLSQKNRMKDKDFQNFPPMPPNHHQRRRFQLMFFMMAECRMHTARSQEGSSSLFIQFTFTFTACNVCHELYLRMVQQSYYTVPVIPQETLKKILLSLSHSGIHMGESHTIGFSYTFAGCRHMKVNAKYELQISLRSDTFPLPLPSVIKVIIWFLIQDSEVCLIHHQLLPQLRNHFNLFLFQPFNCFTLTKITNLVGSL